MAERAVVWTRTVLLQRRAILRYWTIRNGSNRYSKKLLIKIKERLKIVVQFPESGIQTEFRNVRVIGMEQFSIYYVQEESQIVVVSFWDNRQDPEELNQLKSQ